MRSVFLSLFCMFCFGGLHASSDLFSQPHGISRIDHMVTHEQGVFLRVNGCWLSAQEVEAGPEGILVLEDGVWMMLDDAVGSQNYYVWQCPHCKNWNPQGVPWCMACEIPRGS